MKTNQNPVQEQPAQPIAPESSSDDRRSYGRKCGDFTLRPKIGGPVVQRLRAGRRDVGIGCAASEAGSQQAPAPESGAPCHAAGAEGSSTVRSKIS
mgnify:CR=1 FL=1